MNADGKFTPEERDHLKRLLISFKRFWSAEPKSELEDTAATKFIEHIEAIKNA